MYALMLLQTDYMLGGKNPEAGLDCSGLVTVVFCEAAGMSLLGNAAWLTRQGPDHYKRKSASASRLCVIPIACRSGKLNRHLMFKQNWIDSSLKVGLRPRLPLA